MLSLTGLVLCLYLAVSAQATQNGGQYSGRPSAQVKNGTYEGVHSSAYNQDFFLGIPYAQPPVGELRFRNPASLNESWREARQATQYSGEVCALCVSIEES